MQRPTRQRDRQTPAIRRPEPLRYDPVPQSTSGLARAATALCYFSKSEMLEFDRHGVVVSATSIRRAGNAIGIALLPVRGDGALEKRQALNHAHISAQRRRQPEAMIWLPLLKSAQHRKPRINGIVGGARLAGDEPVGANLLRPRDLRGKGVLGCCNLLRIAVAGASEQRRAQQTANRDAEIEVGLGAHPARATRAASQDMRPPDTR